MPLGRNVLNVMIIVYSVQVVNVQNVQLHTSHKVKIVFNAFQIVLLVLPIAIVLNV